MVPERYVPLACRVNTTSRPAIMRCVLALTVHHDNRGDQIDGSLTAAAVSSPTALSR